MAIQGGEGLEQFKGRIISAPAVLEVEFDD